MNYKKYLDTAVPNLLKHAERKLKNNGNENIDTERSNENYELELDRKNLSPLEYYKYRKSQLYQYNRSDIKTLCSWAITAPIDLDPEKEKEFFEACKDFLIERYGNRPEDWIGFFIHKDEMGSDKSRVDHPVAHMHAFFIPTVEDKKHEEFDFKICANECVTRADMRTIHPDLDKYLSSKGIYCSIQTGVTEALGRDISIRELRDGSVSYDKEKMLERHKEKIEKSRWTSAPESLDERSRW